MTDSTNTLQHEAAAARGSPVEVFGAFLKLGLTSFGGPIAHLGYFRSEFVERRRWLDDRSYSDLVAPCQFLPGPASSQVGMALGWQRAGWLGALAAWLGFTLPSAIALILFAFGIAEYHGLAQSGWIHGLKVVAVAIVAQAVWGMAKSLCPDRPRAALAILAAFPAFDRVRDQLQDSAFRYWKQWHLVVLCYAPILVQFLRLWAMQRCYLIRKMQETFKLLWKKLFFRPTVPKRSK